MHIFQDFLSIFAEGCINLAIMLLTFVIIYFVTKRRGE